MCLVQDIHARLPKLSNSFSVSNSQYNPRSLFIFPIFLLNSLLMIEFQRWFTKRFFLSSLFSPVLQRESSRERSKQTRLKSTRSLSWITNLILQFKWRMSTSTWDVRWFRRHWNFSVFDEEKQIVHVASTDVATLEHSHDDCITILIQLIWIKWRTIDKSTDYIIHQTFHILANYANVHGYKRPRSQIIFICTWIYSIFHDFSSFRKCSISHIFQSLGSQCDYVVCVERDLIPFV